MQFFIASWKLQNSVLFFLSSENQSVNLRGLKTMNNFNNAYSVWSIECDTKSLTIDWNSRYWLSSSNESFSSRMTCMKEWKWNFYWFFLHGSINLFISADVKRKSVDQDCSIKQYWSDSFRSLNEGTEYSHRIDSSKIKEAVSHIISSFETSKKQIIVWRVLISNQSSYQVTKAFHPYAKNRRWFVVLSSTTNAMVVVADETTYETR